MLGAGSDEQTVVYRYVEPPVDWGYFIEADPALHVRRHPRLDDDRPAVQFGGDEVDAGPMLGFPGGQRPFVGVQAAKLG